MSIHAVAALAESHDLARQYKKKRLAESGTDLAQLDTI
ncbi:hypothetical protein ASAP_0002 [Asaia bogorensis]|uniref:Uncharacterized protein n=1 Tax=Asaia bogorensis TaxID=91915 RepID=A0A060QGX9_9PROT|nr:hypothetical protein ASAP_0002 [Asaia bogorensis]